MLVGTSTRLNVTAAIRLAKELGQGKTVVTVASDTGGKYMNAKLFCRFLTTVERRPGRRWTFGWLETCATHRLAPSPRERPLVVLVRSFLEHSVNGQGRFMIVPTNYFAFRPNSATTIANLNGVEAQAWLAHLLACVADVFPQKVDQLLRSNW